MDISMFIFKVCVYFGRVGFVGLNYIFRVFYFYECFILDLKDYLKFYFLVIVG